MLVKHYSSTRNYWYINKIPLDKWTVSKTNKTLPIYALILEHMLLGGINLKLKHLITKFQTPLVTTKTIFAKNYGTGAVISDNLNGVGHPVPPVQCWADKNLMSGLKNCIM
jgi:hypothetical protein